MPKTALIVVYNHRYERNLDKIRSLYGQRFSAIRQLVPFARSTDADVVPVYDSSYRFQSFFAQSLPALLAIDCDHYAFVGDDFILNPSLDETNVHSALQLDAETSFISELLPLTRAPASWWRLRSVIKEIKVADGYFKWQAELPPLEEALARFERLGLPTDALTWSPRHSVSGILPLAPGRTLRQLAVSRLAIAYQGPKLPYPLAWGYSDLIVVPRGVLPQFGRHCRALAAMNLFVEAAAPTALALASPRVHTEKDVGWKSTVAWGEADQAQLLRSVGKTLPTLLASFGDREIGKHPVKLSAF